MMLLACMSTVTEPEGQEHQQRMEQISSLAAYLVRRGIELDTAPHGLSDTLWLLMDFLLHEVVVAALHNMVHLHLQGLKHTWHCH